jgi:hypothetical protein
LERRVRFEDAARDTSARLSSIEGDLARHRGEIETTKSRLHCIERRLDLADALA